MANMKREPITGIRGQSLSGVLVSWSGAMSPEAKKTFQLLDAQLRWPMSATCIPTAAAIKFASFSIILQLSESSFKCDRSHYPHPPLKPTRLA